MSRKLDLKKNRPRFDTHLINNSNGLPIDPKNLFRLRFHVLCNMNACYAMQRCKSYGVCISP